jgi:hypothetical protein
VAVTSGDDGRRFARGEHAEWPLGLDEDLTVARAFGLRNSLPQAFFVRADGTVAYRVYGRLDERLVHHGLTAARTPRSGAADVPAQVTRGA